MKPLEQLRKLYLEYSRQRWPSVPYHAVPAFNDKTANGLTRCIVTFINLSGGQAERISSQGRVIDQRQQVTDVIGHTRTMGGIKRIPTAGVRGTADISATIAGRSVKIEVKIGRDQQSEAQLRYQQQVEMAGGIYYIARTFEEFYLWYIDKFQ